MGLHCCGNAVASIGFCVLKWCRLIDAPFCFEKPASSLPWHTGAALDMKRWEHISDCQVNMCAFGAPWKKATRLRSFRLPTVSLLSVRCRKVNKLCQDSVKLHVVLQGRDSQGVTQTSRASAYSVPLARAIARVVLMRLLRGCSLNRFQSLQCVVLGTNRLL